MLVTIRAAPHPWFRRDGTNLLLDVPVTPSEAALMDRHRKIGLEILSACCASPSVLEIVRFAPAWYDGSKSNFSHRGEDLPLGARMLVGYYCILALPLFVIVPFSAFRSLAVEHEDGTFEVKLDEVDKVL